MQNISFTKIDELTIKILHYFIIEKGYNPIILQGAKNEIWLEKLSGDYKIVRISSNYIHNDDQFNFDIFKTKQILKKIKRKTLSVNMNILNIFVNLGENVNISNFTNDQIEIIHADSIDSLHKNETINKNFPDIIQKTVFSENGIDLFIKLTTEINKKGESDALMVEDVFKKKKPFVTISLIAINIIAYLICFMLSGNFFEISAPFLGSFGGLISSSNMGTEYYRIFTSAFLHVDLIHIFFNCYVLYTIGSQLESFYGKTKYLIVYLLSAIIGNLLALLFLNDTTVAVGASGAIFGLFGSLLYFGYHYRAYLGSVLRTQILPLIIFNLMLGFIIPGIGNGAHIGGLIGGILISMAVGVKNKTTKSEQINGIIMSIILISFLIYMGFLK